MLLLQQPEEMLLWTYFELPDEVYDNPNFSYDQNTYYRKPEVIRDNLQYTYNVTSHKENEAQITSFIQQEVDLRNNSIVGLKALFTKKTTPEDVRDEVLETLRKWTEDPAYDVEVYQVHPNIRHHELLNWSCYLHFTLNKERKKEQLSNSKEEMELES